MQRARRMEFGGRSPFNRPGSWIGPYNFCPGFLGVCAFFPLFYLKLSVLNVYNYPQNCHKWLSAKRSCAVLYVPERCVVMLKFCAIYF